MDGSTPINSIPDSIDREFRKAADSLLERFEDTPTGRVLCCGYRLRDLAPWLEQASVSKIFLMEWGPAEPWSDRRMVRLSGDYEKVLPAFPDGTFQAIFVHWPPPALLTRLDEIRRLLGPGGTTAWLIARDRSPTQIFDLLERCGTTWKAAPSGLPRSVSDVRTLWDRAKILDNRVWEGKMEFALNSAEEVRANLDRMGGEALYRSLAPEDRGRLASTMERKIEEELRSAGRFVMEYPYLGVVSRV